MESVPKYSFLRPRHGRGMALVLLAIVGCWPVLAARAESCSTAEDIPVPTKTALEQAARQFFQSAAAGDVAALRSKAVASLAADFSGVEAAVTQNQASLHGGQSTVSSVFLLDATGSGNAPIQRAEFYCGIFNSPERTTFIIPNLPPGRYAVVVQNVSGGKAPLFLTTVLNEQGGAWKLAGLTIKPQRLGDRDADYYLAKAREAKSRGQSLIAWLDYLQGWDLMGPVNFMYTAKRDKIADEMQQSKPADLPTQQNPLQLSAGGKTYAVTQMFPEVVDMQGRKDLYLIVKYQATTDVENTAQTFAANTDLIRAVVTRYPELRTAFDGVVARAVAPTGRDYGTMLAMKDVR